VYLQFDMGTSHSEGHESQKFLIVEKANKKRRDSEATVSLNTAQNTENKYTSNG